MMPSRNAETGKVDVSILAEFVKFLETESAPKTPIRLNAEEMVEEAAAARRSRQSSVSSSTPSQLDVSETASAPFAAPKSGSPNPLVMAGNSGSVSSSAMPSLPTFSVNRSSSAILRHVLQEEES